MTARPKMRGGRTQHFIAHGRGGGQVLLAPLVDALVVQKVSQAYVVQPGQGFNHVERRSRVAALVATD